MGTEITFEQLNPGDKWSHDEDGRWGIYEYVRPGYEGRTEMFTSKDKNGDAVSTASKDSPLFLIEAAEPMKFESEPMTFESESTAIGYEYKTKTFGHWEFGGDKTDEWLNEMDEQGFEITHFNSIETTSGDHHYMILRKVKS